VLYKLILFLPIIFSVNYAINTSLLFGLQEKWFKLKCGTQKRVLERIQMLKPTKHKVRGASIVQELYCGDVDVKSFLMDANFIRVVFKLSKCL